MNALSKDDKLRLEGLFKRIFDSRASFMRKMHEFQVDYKERHLGWSESTWRNVWTDLTTENGPGRIDPQTKIDLLIYCLRDATPSERKKDAKMALEILSKLDDCRELKEKLLHLKPCTDNGAIIVPPRAFTIRSGETVGRAVRSDHENSTWQGQGGVKAIAPVWAADSFHREFASFHFSSVGWSVTYLEKNILGLAVNGDKMKAGHTRPIRHNDMVTFAGEWHFLIQDDDRPEKEYRAL